MPDEKMDKAKEAATKMVMLAFRDGFNTALIQLESYLIQTYSNKVLGIKDPQEIVSLPEDKLKQVMDSSVPLGTFLAAINQTRDAVEKIMSTKPQATNESKPEDKSVILQ